MYILLILLGLVFIFILVFNIYKNKKEQKRKIWQESIATVLSETIFYSDDDEVPVDLTFGDKRLLKNTAFRQTIVDEVIHVMKNISGSSKENIKKLYETLTLDSDSFHKLNNTKWHIKAKGILELEVMEQKKYAKQIFKLTNHENEHVRNEVQSALVNYYGFSGLRFLNVISYPISQWQQIQLLNKLHSIKPDDVNSIKKWMQSPNDSVVNFSLKLATINNCYEVQENVTHCLQNKNLLVKLSALEYLKLMPREEAIEQIISNYSIENKRYKLKFLEILKDIGSEKQLVFLLKQLHNEDNDIKAAAAKSLAYLHPSGTSLLHEHLFADEYPWNAIFRQIENDRAA